MIHYAIPLAAMGPGDQGVVIKMGVPGGLGQRLEDMGMIPGTRILCRMKAPGAALGAYEVRGTVIALRRADAGNISVGVEK